MKRAMLACLVAACSSPQRSEPPAVVPADATIDARGDARAPADAFVTSLIPPDATHGNVIVTTSDDGA